MASCVIKIAPLAPGVKFVGLPKTLTPPKVTLKLFAKLKSGVIVAPSVNAEPLDPELEDYPPVVTPTNRSMSLALSNSFGFGGTNVTLVLSRE